MLEFLQNLIIPRYKNNFHPYLLRKRSLAVITLVVLGVNILGSSIGESVFAGAVSSAELVTLANAERSAAGLGTLRTDPRLVSAAHAKAENIFELQYWSHYGPSGETPWQFIIGSGYNYVFAGENLAKGFSSSEAAHSAWMASQTHRDNIMNVSYQDIGIAVVSGTLEGSEVILVVQMFGALTESPAVSLPVTTVPDVQSTYGASLLDDAGLIVRIDYPESGDILTDNEFLMKGQTSESIESIIVTDNEDETEGIITENGVWDYRPDNGWSEGAHAVMVSDETRVVSDTVDFEVDTVPPVIDEESVQIVKSQDAGGMVEISVEADETAAEAVLVAGGFSVLLTQRESGAFTTKISVSELSSDENTVKVIVSDEVGNTSEVNITEGIRGIVEEEGVSESFAGSIDISWWVTRGVVVLIAVLLIIDIVFLFRLKIVHTRGKTLFPLAVWLIVLAVAMVVGTGGSIL